MHDKFSAKYIKEESNNSTPQCYMIIQGNILPKLNLVSHMTPDKPHELNNNMQTTWRKLFIIQQRLSFLFSLFYLFLSVSLFLTLSHSPNSCKDTQYSHVHVHKSIQVHLKHSKLLHTQIMVTQS